MKGTVSLYAREGILYVRPTKLPDGVFALYRDATEGARFSRYEGASHLRVSDFDTVMARLRTLPETRVVVDRSALELVAHERASRERAAEQARARTSALYPYQQEGVSWLASRRSGLLADEMGLGKTVQILMALPEGQTLIVCPAVAIGTWVREIRRWRPDLLPLVTSRQRFEVGPSPYVTIVSYDSLPDVTPPRELTLIADEAHAVKSPKAVRTKRFRMLAARVFGRWGRVWLATGTPLENKPTELWSLLQAGDLAREAFGSWETFVELFGGTPKGTLGRWVEKDGKRSFEPDPAGTSGERGMEWTIASARVRPMLDKVMLRRRRVDVLPDLPTKTYARVDAALDEAATARCDAFVTEFLRDGESAQDLHARLSKPATFERVAEMLELLSAAKIPSMLETVASFEDAEEPLVVMSANRRPVEALRKRKGWGVVLGDDSAEARARTVERFQAGELRGIAGTIGALGTSVTLTRASKLLFVGRAWNPEKNRQAEDRVCRIGQDRGVTIYDLVSPHALDERLHEVLSEKDVLIASVLSPSEGA
jgi:SNF2 family DNA or RNA helicase